MAKQLTKSNAGKVSQREDDSTLVVTNAPPVAGCLNAEMYHHGGVPNQTTNGDNGHLIVEHE